MNSLRVIGCLAVWLLSSGFASAPEPNRPDILLVLVDDMGWRDAGFMGARGYSTPHLDALAKRGVVFDSAYSNAPNCAPSRASLLTGQYTPRHGVYTVGRPDRGAPASRKMRPPPNRRGLAFGTRTIAGRLRAAGYRTGFVGKWHLGGQANQSPTRFGFDYSWDGGAAGRPASHFSPFGLDGVDDGPEGESLLARVNREALGFALAEDDRPYFLVVSHYAVHAPLQADPARVEKYRKAFAGGGPGVPIYAAMLEEVDASVGALLDGLGEKRDDTLVVFYSDNGGVARFTSMAPLRGEKGTLYEAGIRVPLVVAGPGVHGGRRTDVPVLGSDVSATVLAAAGVELPRRRFDGRSLAPTLRGEGDSFDRALFWHFPAYLQDKVRPGEFRTRPAGAIRRGDWKLIEFFESGAVELYDLKRDPSESNDLATREAPRVAALRAELHAWREDVGAAMPTPLEARSAVDVGAALRDPTPDGVDAVSAQDAAAAE